MNSYHLSAWYCIDIVRRNSVLVTHRSWAHLSSLTIESTPTYDMTKPFCWGSNLKNSMDTNENIDWKIPNGIPVMILMVIKYNTVGICRSSRIFLMLKTLAGCSLLSERKHSNYVVMLIESFLNLFYMPLFKGGSFDST